MTTWYVTSIEAAPEIPCISSLDTVIWPSDRLPIWNIFGDFKDGATGSFLPVTFVAPNVSAPGYTARIALTGTCIFPPFWMGRYILKAWIGRTQVLQSQEMPIPRSESQGNVRVVGLWLMVPNFAAATSTLPFRWAGDFSWTITLAGTSTLLPPITLPASEIGISYNYLTCNCPQNSERVKCTCNNSS